MLSVRCVVSDVTPERVSVIFEPSLPPTRGHYVRSLLSETFMWTVTKSMKANSSLTHDEVVKSWTGFEFGDTITGRVMATKKYGIVLKAVAGSAKKRELEGDADDPQLLLCPPEHAPDHDLEEGLDIKVGAFLYIARSIIYLYCRNPICNAERNVAFPMEQVRIIGVDMEKKVWDVTMDGDLVKVWRILVTISLWCWAPIGYVTYGGDLLRVLPSDVVSIMLFWKMVLASRVHYLLIPVLLFRLLTRNALYRAGRKSEVPSHVAAAQRRSEYICENSVGEARGQVRGSSV